MDALRHSPLRSDATLGARPVEILKFHLGSTEC